MLKLEIRLLKFFKQKNKKNDLNPYKQLEAVERQIVEQCNAHLLRKLIFVLEHRPNSSGPLPANG
jgi:hypothetical protein